MTDDYKRGLVTGLAMQPLAVVDAEALINNPLTDYEYISALSAKCNGITYTAEKDESTGLISKISDSNGNEFEPTINSGITDVALHNAAIMAIAMANGITKTVKFDYAGIFAFYDMSTLNIDNAIWSNKLSSNYNIILKGGSIENSCLHLTTSDYGTLTCNEPMTIYALFKTFSTGNYHSVISKHMTTYNQYHDFAIVINPNVLLSCRSSIVTSTVDARTSHVVCITRSSTSAKLYIDGVYIGSTTTALGDYYGEYTLNKSLRGDGIGDYPGDHLYRMLALGSEEHTAEQIAINSKYILENYRVI